MEFTRLAKRYRGGAADRYDSDREQTGKWALEQAAVETLLSVLPAGLSVVDIPVGTGRFIDLYQKLGLVATGIDVSTDMLGRAEEKARRMDAPIVLQQGDIRAISAPDGAFDLAVCVDPACTAIVLDAPIHELTDIDKKEQV